MTKRLTDQEKKSFVDKTQVLLEKRIQMAEFPMTQDELYLFWQSLMPSEVIEALHTVTTNSVTADMLSTRNRIILNAAGFKLNVYGDSLLWRTPLGGLDIPPDNKNHKELHDFMALRHRVDLETITTSRIVNSLVSHANAAGQIKRVWPELASFLSSEAASSLRNVTRASRIPPHFNMEEFNQRKDMLNRVLAEAHILPRLKHEGMSFAVNLQPIKNPLQESTS